MGVKFGMEEGPPPPCQISPPSVQRVAPARRKTSKSASSKLNTGRFALRAMLPVTRGTSLWYSARYILWEHHLSIYPQLASMIWLKRWHFCILCAKIITIIKLTGHNFNYKPKALPQRRHKTGRINVCQLPIDTQNTIRYDTVCLTQHRYVVQIWLVSWSLMSLFSTNMAISKTKGQAWKLSIPSEGRLASDILTSTLAAFLFNSHPKRERDRSETQNKVHWQSVNPQCEL